MKQTKLRWQKQKKEKKEIFFRKLIVKKEIEIARMVKEEEEKKEDLIKIKLERMLIKKTWNYTINLREDFILKKRRIYLLSRIKKEKIQKFMKDQLKKEYIRLLKLL